MSFFDKLISGLEILTKSIAWIRIFIAPTLAGFLLGIGLAIYLSNIYSLYVFLGSLILGIAIGLYFAEKMRKKYGTIEFMSQIDSSPDIDKKN